MNKENDTDSMVGCLLMLLMLASSVPLIMLDAWILLQGYNWVILPAFPSLPQLTYHNTLCIQLFKIMVSTKPYHKDDDDGTLKKSIRLWWHIIFFTGVELFLLGVIYVIH